MDKEHSVTFVPRIVSGRVSLAPRQSSQDALRSTCSTQNSDRTDCRAGVAAQCSTSFLSPDRRPENDSR